MSALSISSISSTGRSSMRERLPQLALADVVADVGHALVAQLAVAQAAHGVVLVEALQRLGGGLDVPLDERRADRLGDLDGEHRLAGARLALDQQWPLQRDGSVNGHLEVVGGDVVLGTLELHDRCICFSSRQKRRAELRETPVGQQAAPRSDLASAGAACLDGAWDAPRSASAGTGKRRWLEEPIVGKARQQAPARYRHVWRAPTAQTRCSEAGKCKPRYFRRRFERLALVGLRLAALQ